MTSREAAVGYVARGWCVLPLTPGEKRPATEHGKDDASTDLVTVEEWFATPNRNVGIHAERSGIIVVDIDPRNGGLEQYNALVDELGDPPIGPTADTGGGGVHRLFRAPRIDEIRHELRAKLRKGVDLIRGNNYIVAPPSVHPSGGTYSWRAGLSPADVELPDFPAEWLSIALRDRPQPTLERRDVVNFTGDSVYDVLGQMNQKHVLEYLSGTWLVNGETFTFRRNANGKYNLFVDGKERGNFIDADGKIGAPDTGKKDGGPLASTWLRWYGHDDKRIREGLIEFVPDLERFKPRAPTSSPTYSGPDAPHAAEQTVQSNAQVTPKIRSTIVVEVARLETPPIRSYSTGNLQLDALTGGGINTRELMIVMGPPAAGKTAFAISTCMWVQRTLPVLYASTELEQHELMARIAAYVLGRPWSAIRRGTVNRAEVVEALDGIQIHILGCDSLPRNGEEAILAIEAEAIRLTREFAVPPLIVVDYLQDLARGAERDIRSRVGDQAGWLRAMSQRLDCGLVAVSSVSRTFYSAKKAQEYRELDDATAYLAAAKESGDVDYAAARVLFLDAEDARDKPERDVRIAVAKSRDARTGFAGARMVGETGRYYESPIIENSVKASLDDRNGEDETIMISRVRAEWGLGNGDKCTTTAIRTGNGISKERAESALHRLRVQKRIRLIDVKRHEDGRAKTRQIFELVEGASL